MYLLTEPMASQGSIVAAELRKAVQQVATSPTTCRLLRHPALIWCRPCPRAGVPRDVHAAADEAGEHQHSGDCSGAPPGRRPGPTIPRHKAEAPTHHASATTTQSVSREARGSNQIPSGACTVVTVRRATPHRRPPDTPGPPQGPCRTAHPQAEGIAADRGPRSVRTGAERGAEGCPGPQPA